MEPFKYREELGIYREIRREVRNMRIVTALFFAVAYILLAKDTKYFYVPLLLGIVFLLFHILRFSSPWIPIMSSLLLNISVVLNTGIQKSPFIFLFLIPVISHGIEREPNWALRIAVINTFFLAILEVYSAILGDAFGIAYINGIIVLMYWLSRIIVKTQGSLLSYAIDMEKKAYIDPLTGLYNRRALEKYINDMILNKTPFTLLMSDLDGFKKYNDTYGHQAGDVALKTFADILKNSIRSTDLSFRYGGDEFVIVLPGELENVEFLYERIRSNLKKNLNNINISFGLALFPKDGNSLEEILTIADKSLYREKNNKVDEIS
ncbi:MAG: GGDEF domain-containing protein [bacterium]|nr:GGDEF domain-containing protein [bacterium]